MELEVCGCGVQESRRTGSTCVRRETKPKKGLNSVTITSVRRRGGTVVGCS